MIKYVFIVKKYKIISLVNTIILKTNFVLQNKNYIFIL